MRARFNDVHKMICAALAVDPDTARELRPVVMRSWARGQSANFCLTMARMHLAEKVAREDAELAALPTIEASEVVRGSP